MMGTPRKGIPWLRAEDRALRKLWHSGERIKNHMHLFGEHTYAAVITHAHDMGLGKRRNCPRGQAPIAAKLMLRELGKKPANRFRLADLLNLDPSTTHKRLYALHKLGQVHIIGWERRTDHSAVVPVYAVGKGVDAAKPAALSSVEKERRRRARKKQVRILSGEVIKTVNPFGVAMAQLQVAA